MCPTTCSLISVIGWRARAGPLSSMTRVGTTAPSSRYLQELCAYWQHEFDWRAAEARLNSWPQFATEVDGEHLHFIHARSPHPDAVPLIITHGWPGSVVEFLDILGPLTDPVAHGGDAADAFHVVCPSMPGYGWSGPTHQQGWDIRRVAEANATLMAQLGYERYGAQGGDWGAIATTLLGLADPDHLIGLHVNMVIAGPPTGSSNPMQGLTEAETQAVADMTHFQQHETGYQAIQGTKPQTLGYGLTDSPAGLAGWIVEKFRTWSDCNGDVESSFTKDQLLTNITAYWVTNTISSSVRLYCESQRARANGPAPDFVEVPTGVAIFPKELYPRAALVGRGRLQHQALDRHAAGRALRGDGRTRAARRRHAGVLPARAVTPYLTPYQTPYHRAS